LSIFLALVTIALYVSCDSLASDWGKTGRTLSIVVGTISALIGYLAFAWLNKYWSLAQAGAFVNVGIALGAVAVGYFFFKEELTTIQWWGVALGLVSIFMLASGGK